MGRDKWLASGRALVGLVWAMRPGVVAAMSRAGVAQSVGESKHSALGKDAKRWKKETEREREREKYWVNKMAGLCSDGTGQQELGKGSGTEPSGPVQLRRARVRTYLVAEAAMSQQGRNKTRGLEKGAKRPCFL